MKRHFTHPLLLVFFAVGVAAIDLWTKSIAVEAAQLGDLPYAVTSFFNIVLAWNPGVSFGLLHGIGGQWLFIVILGALCVGLFVWMVRAHHPFLSMGISLILGGALGNMIDRIRYGAVIDFLDVHFAGFHWWTFNIADIAISVGAFMIFLDGPLGVGKEK